jgi:hypothetical protein
VTLWLPPERAARTTSRVGTPKSTEPLPDSARPWSVGFSKMTSVLDVDRRVARRT